ncbi:hypothetical protein [Clostridium sp. MD294]|uniref:hypothetical protein n=1 Tax=Clostridium sp. MD294 TaxID=97138 RepID=UPI0002CA870B|nr:hypothetical protein [Clostridium sp. MD294]NDO45661.1 hypothetical protein [Clostridium sp. MD294]USF30683.1 hypothetical protein C820_002126 [Clostridium sp. MD294]
MINDVFLNRVIDLKSKIDKEKSFNDGMKAGAKNQKIEILITMYNKGYELQEISSVVNMTVTDVNKIIKEYELRKKSGVNVMPVKI